MNNRERYEAVVALSEYNVFSATHLSQLSGVSKTTVLAWVSPYKRGKSGKFNPRTVDMLLQLRQNRLAGAPVNEFLLQQVLDNGNSQLLVARLTGLSQSAISRRAHETDSNSVLRGPGD